MISIIICSREKTIKTCLSDNIKTTVGCNYELIIVDNSNNNLSIFQAYNLGIEKSIGNYICFVHDDILFHTNGWGNKLLRIFSEDPNIGLIGIGGAKVKTKMPSAWWDCPENEKILNIIQHFPNKEKKKWTFGFKRLPNEEVVVIDGVFMAARKDQKISFNETMLGFHNYDLNLSFEYKRKGYKIIVSNEILLEHFSLGSLNEDWLNSNYQVHDLYEEILPLKCKGSDLIRKTEINNAKKFIEESLMYRKIDVAIRVWMKLFYLEPISLYHIRFWKRSLKKLLC